MAGLLLAAFLIVLIAYVHLRTKTEPLRSKSPLDVEEHLPPPWILQASAVFSLSGLFGAFLTLLTYVGVPGILGAAIGSCAGLLLIRGAVKKQDASFQSFLRSRAFSLDPLDNRVLWGLLIVVQVVFGVYELTLLRGLSIEAFDLIPAHATALATSVAIVAYFYCLRGGYAAVFRTDIVQLICIIIMCAIIGSHDLLSPPRVSSDGFKLPEGLFTFGFVLPTALERVLIFLVSASMALTFLICTPDTWKRVHLTIKEEETESREFWLLILAGAAPFLLLLPVLRRTAANADTLDPFQLLVESIPSDALLSVLILGLVSAFLSTFDSVLVATTHLITAEPYQEDPSLSLPEYHVRLGLIFLVVFLLFLGIPAIAPNPFFLASLLVTPFAVLGGIVLATSFLSSPIKSSNFSLIVLLGIVIWIVWVGGAEVHREKISSDQLSALSTGFVILVGTFLLTALFRLLESRNPSAEESNER